MSRAKRGKRERRQSEAGSAAVRDAAAAAAGGLRIRGQRAQHRGKESNGLIDAMTISSKSTDKTRDRSSLALSFDRSFERPLFIRKWKNIYRVLISSMSIIATKKERNERGRRRTLQTSISDSTHERPAAPRRIWNAKPCRPPDGVAAPMGFPSLLGCWFCRRCICQFRRLNPLISPLLKGEPPLSLHDGSLPPSAPRSFFGIEVTCE